MEEGNNTYYTLMDFGRDLVHIFRHLEDLEEKYCKMCANIPELVYTIIGKYSIIPEDIGTFKWIG